MSSILAGATLTAMFVALCLVLIVWTNRRRIANAWRRVWTQKQIDGPDRDEEDGVPAAWRQQPLPASRPPATTSKRLVISAPQPAELETLAHKPLTPAVYAVPPPPPHLLVSPPTPTPPARALLPPAHPPWPLPHQQQQQSRPVQATLRPNVPRKPLRQPMLPPPQPALSPIPYHRNHLVPPPLRVGPNRRIDVSPTVASVGPLMEESAASGHAVATDNVHSAQKPLQHRPPEQKSNENADAADNNSGKNTSLSPGNALRDSTGSGSTGSDSTLAESPRIMEARAQTVIWPPPSKQDPKAEKHIAATAEPSSKVGTGGATGTATPQ